VRGDKEKEVELLGVEKLRRKAETLKTKEEVTSDQHRITETGSAGDFAAE